MAALLIGLTTIKVMSQTTADGQRPMNNPGTSETIDGSNLMAREWFFKTGLIFLGFAIPH